MRNPIISMKDINIRFGDILANDNVSIDIYKGEIVALLGENGAGKSTLMKILYGIYARESGAIKINAETMPLRFSPADALKKGISMVSQHFMLVDSFTVAENIVMGEEYSFAGRLVDKSREHELVMSLSEEFGIPISPDRLVGELPLGLRQKVEILKALYRGKKVLILDEPTTVLTPLEVEELFDHLRSLKDKGMTIILITHKLDEVMSISDRAIVMRQGKKVASLDTKATNISELSRCMVGADVESIHVETKEIKNDLPVTLQLSNVSTELGDNGRCLKNISLKLFPGRILGIAGIEGNGQTELVEVLTGLTKIQSGQMKIGNQIIDVNSSSVMKSIGIGVIPEDRIEQGLVLDLSIQDNIMLGYRDDPRFVKGGTFSRKRTNQFVDNVIRNYDIRPARKTAICRFVSGGNQQKVVLARELERTNLKIVVASQPSRGLDVGAINFTHKTILRLREEGKAVLLISSDLDEIMAMSDDIAVIRDGTIVSCCKACELSKNEIGLMMGSSKSQRAS